MARTKKSSRKKNKKQKTREDAGNHQNITQKQSEPKICLGQEKRIHENTKERRPMLDGNPENQRKAGQKKGKGNMRNASKYNRKLNP